MQTGHTAPNDAFQALAISQHSMQLRNHLLECEQARGKMFSLYRMGERVHQMVAPRLYTTAIATSMMIYLALGWIYN